ncbi:MAG: hypothetical protein GY782_05765, partial [Gammaproteobacteria bacterium]|nr:hypothetical protein [Gammaproteobacteria bacterium]
MINISQNNFDFFSENFSIFLKFVEKFLSADIILKKFEKFSEKKSKFFCEMLIKCRSVRKNNFYFFYTVFESFMDSQSLLTRPLFLSFFVFPRVLSCPLNGRKLSAVLTAFFDFCPDMRPLSRTTPPPNGIGVQFARTKQDADTQEAYENVATSLQYLFLGAHTDVAVLYQDAGSLRERRWEQLQWGLPETSLSQCWWLTSPSSLDREVAPVFLNKSLAILRAELHRARVATL